MLKKQIVTPPEIRGRWYLQTDKYGKSVKEVCEIFGISRKTYYKWYNRDHPIGMTGKRPKRMHPHTKLVGNIRVVVVETKLKYNYGPRKMSKYLKANHDLDISPSTIYKFYKKKKLIRKPQRHQKWYQPMKEPFYAEFAGENVQLDVKYIPGPGLTWQYQFRFIDQATNMQYAINMDCKDSLSAICAFKKAKKYFSFKISGVQTDNGSEFRGRFHDYLVRQNIIQRYIPKRSAPWNGKVERAHRSCDDEYYLNPHRPWKTISQYVYWYNYKRPHLGKGMDGMTPYQKLLLVSQKCHP